MEHIMGNREVMHNQGNANKTGLEIKCESMSVSLWVWGFILGQTNAVMSKLT